MILPCWVFGTGAAANEQVLRVNNERFMVPEALFHPSDIGLNQAGEMRFRAPFTILRPADATHWISQCCSSRFALVSAMLEIVTKPSQGLLASVLHVCAGLAETIVQSVEAVHEDLHGLLYSNVLLTGVYSFLGCAFFLSPF